WPNRTACARGSIQETNQRSARDRPASGPGVRTGLGRSRARTLVLQGAPPVWRQPSPRGTAPARVAEVQPAQHRLALFPRRDVSRRRPQERSEDRAAARAGSAVRSGLGAGESGVQRPGAALIVNACNLELGIWNLQCVID